MRQHNIQITPKEITAPLVAIQAQLVKVHEWGVRLLILLRIRGLRERLCALMVEMVCSLIHAL